MTVTRRRLLVGQDIRLHAWEHDGTDFIRLFRGCWKQIPLSARRAILAHWRTGDGPRHPLIELSNLWCDSETCFAQVTSRGMELKFNAEAFDILPPSVARWIIAHELAHVYQKACGQVPGGEDEHQNENDADRIAEGWGFDKSPRTLLELLQQNRGLTLGQACEAIVREESGHGLNNSLGEAEEATMIFFRAGRGDLDTAAAALADSGMSVRRVGDELAVSFGSGPQLRVVLVQEPYVRQEAKEIGEGTPYAVEMSRCEARYDILIDDLDAVLHEVNTLSGVQAALQDVTEGFLFNTWDSVLSGPESKRASRR